MDSYFRCGFRLNETIEATVRCVKNDRIRFSVINVFGEECCAWYYTHGEHINLHRVFKQGSTIDVCILSISKDARCSGKTLIEVRPQLFPIDTYLAKTPLGSTVSGKIALIRGSYMLIEIAQDVVCRVKKFRTARVGMSISCLLSRYNANRKVLFATVL